MGQYGSCIQGQPDWLGPYEKASAKNQDSDTYEQIRKLAVAASTSKDFSELENFLKIKINPTCPQHGSKSDISSRNFTLPASSKLEDIFKKESHCKDINFNQSQKETKMPIVKPIIVPKSTCAVHGHKVNHQAPKPCKVHGYQKTEVRKVEVKTTLQEAKLSSPPAYRYPPVISSTPPQATTNSQSFNTYEDLDLIQECENSFERTFSCPDFLLDLILPTKESEVVDVLASVGVQSAKETVQRLEDRAESIVETFGVVLKHLEHGDWSTFCISTSRLCDDIRRVMRDYHLSSEVVDPEAIKIKNHVSGALNQLTTRILSLSQNSTPELNQNVLLPSFKVLGEVLHEMMEFLISKELKVLIDCIDNGANNICTQMAICAVAEMSLSGGLMCNLIVQSGAILPLLNVCKARKYHYLHPLVLRTLTAITSSKKALEELEKLSAFETILLILKDESDEKVLSEAVGFLAQILKQWSESGSSLSEKLGQNVEHLTKYLSGTAQKALSPEMFLLSAACLATLSPCSRDASKWLNQHAEEMRLLAHNTKQESYV